MRLTDLFMELIAYVAYFNKSVAVKQLPFEQVKADILRLMSDTQNKMTQANVTQEDFDSARFAMVAWVDETILSSEWQFRDMWQREPLPLQRMYYQTAEAGERFFERLNTIGPHQRDVREVYYLCLAMGFKGGYCHEGDDYLLDQLKASNLKLLIGTSIGLPTLEKGDLFPEAYPVESETPSSPKGGARFSKFTLTCLGIPVVLYLGLFVIYTFILEHIRDSFLAG